MRNFNGMDNFAQALSLAELLVIVKDGVESCVPAQLWLKAEISEISARATGHCYLELIQNSPSGVSARARAVIWASSYRMLKAYFESETGTALDRGMKVLVKVQVTFSELYSLTLVITDIEPSYSVGEQEMARRKVIERLEREGLMDMNRTLPMPRLPLRLAVVSSDTAAGYMDFVKHLSDNVYGFKFITELFPALMQGADAPSSIVGAMDRAAQKEGEFDMLLIMRGGGSKADLSCYDDYSLAANIAQFPIPVMTGIGHERDMHICDMVAAISVKTPTAMADALIEICAEEDLKLETFLRRVEIAAESIVSARLALLDMLAQKAAGAVDKRLSLMMADLDMLERRLVSADPDNTLARGYALAFGPQGTRLCGVHGISPGERLKLRFPDGILSCLVEDTYDTTDTL